MTEYRVFDATGAPLWEGCHVYAMTIYHTRPQALPLRYERVETHVVRIDDYRVYFYLPAWGTTRNDHWYYDEKTGRVVPSGGAAVPILARSNVSLSNWSPG